MIKFNKIYIPVFFIIIITIFATYIKTFSYDFAYDDFVLVVGNQQIASLSPGNIFKIFSSMDANYLPTRFFSYAVDYHFWGESAGGFRITNFIIHSLNSFLVFLIFMKIFAKTSLDSKKFLPFSIVAAIIFAIHPIQVEPVVWVSGRKDLLSLFFVASAFLFFWNNRVRKVASNSRFLVLLVLFFLAVTSKASAIYFPIFLFFTDMFLFYKESDKSYRRNILTEHFILAFIMLLIIYLDVSGSVRSDIFPKIFRNNTDHILTILYVPLIYIKMFIYPINLLPEYNISLAFNSFLIVCIFSGAAFIVSAAYLAFRNRKDVFFAIIWFLIALVPVSQILPVQQVVADRYLYHSMAPLCYLIAVGLYELFKKNKMASALLVVLMLSFLFSITSKQCEYWKNDYALWNRVLKFNDKSPRAYHNIAQFYLRLDDEPNAEKYYLKAIASAPEDLTPRIMLAQLYFLSGRNDEAISQMEQMISIRKDLYQVYRNLGILYKKTGKMDKAVQTYNKALTVFPGDLYFRKALLNTGDESEKPVFDTNIRNGNLK